MVKLRKKWKRTDAWRGYEEYENSVADGCFLWGDETHNKSEKERISKVKNVLKKNKIPHRVAKGKTSNVFSVCYDIVVDKNNVSRAKKLVDKVI